MRRADFGIALQRPHAPAGPDRRRHAAGLEDAAHAAHGVGAAAEAEQVDAVAGLPDADDLGVAVDDVLGDAEAGCLAQQIVDAPQPRDLDGLALGARAEPAVVEGKLQLGVDAAVGADAGGAKQLVDVAARLVGHVAAGLARAIREDQDVLAHLRLPFGPVASVRLSELRGPGGWPDCSGKAKLQDGRRLHPQGRAAPHQRSLRTSCIDRTGLITRGQGRIGREAQQSAVHGNKEGIAEIVRHLEFGRLW